MSSAEYPLMDGKVVVVTGAGRGIGRAIALMMAAEGAAVIVNDIGTSMEGEGQDATPAQRVVDEIRDAGGRAAADFHDISEWSSAQRLIEHAVDEFGALDSVVNNAGILRDAIFHKMVPEEFAAVIKVHLFGSFNVSRAAAEIFRPKMSGSMVHMTSVSGLVGSIGQANYSAAKMGIVGMSRSIALDMARFNVRSNCIAPSAFSRMIESVPGATPEEQQRNIEKRKKQTRPEQVAPLAVFLASEAAEGISGQIMGARGNEFYLYNQSRPIRTLHRSDGWTPSSVAGQLPHAWKSAMTPLERGRDVFSWEAL